MYHSTNSTRSTPHSTMTVQIYTVSQKKVPTFKLSITLSKLNRFSKNLHCWKAYKICYRTHTTLPPYLRRVATLPTESLKVGTFLRHSVCLTQLLTTAAIPVHIHVCKNVSLLQQFTNTSNNAIHIQQRMLKIGRQNCRD